jgi:hypothetical protein
MAPTQTILFTVMPRSLSISGERLPISVYVSPRLMGESVLGAFPDWLDWTARLQEGGMLLIFEAEGQSFEAAIDREPLRPDLWRALFNQETFVRSHAFQDNTGAGVLSYGVRETLSAIKGLYQEAGVSLALPAQDGDQAEDARRSRNRERLSQLLDGMEVHWNERRGREWREALAHPQRRRQGRAASPLDAEGLLPAEPSATAHSEVAIPFATYHHMPQIADEEPAPLPPDVNANRDFHDALTALNSHPELLRALGLVFDFELPADLVPETPGGGYGTISVRQVNQSWDWGAPTTTPPLESAYVHQAVDDGRRVFAPAPRRVAERSYPTQVAGLLALDPARFGLAQVDVDAAMHKVIIQAEIVHPEAGRNLDPGAELEPAPHQEVYDPDATLPALRSGGLQLYADERAVQLLEAFQDNKEFNGAVEGGGAQQRPFFAEDLLRGYRLDVWDSQTNAWHSLHARSGAYEIGEERAPFATEAEEGFVQLAATRAVPEAVNRTDDYYLHEVVARWAGWSLSAPLPAKALSKHGDPKKAIPQDGDPDYAVDEPITPFVIRATYRVLPGSLPRLRFGTRYRIRARAVDLCGNSMRPGDSLLEALSAGMALPRDSEGMAYLRFEPVISPQVILRDTRAVTEPGSQLDRLVIRTFNSDPSLDSSAADLTAADRHLVPPRAPVELGERHGMFDDASGRLSPDPAIYQLIAQRDAGEFNQVTVAVAGQDKQFPLEPADSIAALPHLPDPLARGAALRDLPGTPGGSRGRATDLGAPGPVAYTALDDPNPRPGSVTLIPFGQHDADPDWQNLQGVRLALSEPQPEQPAAPQWEQATRTLTLFLPKGQTAVVPLSSYMSADDLKRMGLWQWLREHIERITLTEPRPQYLEPGRAIDELAHVLQRAVEGGHWMLTPPKLLTLVHAVQQPLGRPRFAALTVAHTPLEGLAAPLQTALSQGRGDPSELAPLAAWRRPGGTEAYLLGALQLHGASTSRVDLVAVWEDPVDDPGQPAPTRNRQEGPVETLPLNGVREHTLRAAGAEYRAVGHYDPEHDQIAFLRAGSRFGDPNENESVFYSDAAPRHTLSDTKRRRVQYTAIATTRYQEYFAQDQGLEFTRSSEPVVVDVPASERPLAPSVQYVVPTFGWQRQTETNLKRSVRFGGGLRVYLNRPWYSSGEGELLGVALYSFQDGALDDTKRQKWKPFISQWGMDPIWQSAALDGYPHIGNFAGHVEQDLKVSLEEAAARTSAGGPGLVDVVGFPVAFDEERRLWYADVTLNVFTATYAPFVRLALVRYQPHALPDARISRVVLADFAQLTPDRSAMVTLDPHHPRRVRVVVSGVAPRGPSPSAAAPARPTVIRVRAQQREPGITSDLAWQDLPGEVAQIVEARGPAAGQPDLALYVGQITFATRPAPNQYRLVVEEYEQIAADYSVQDGDATRLAGRLIYAELFELDTAVVA